MRQPTTQQRLNEATRITVRLAAEWRSWRDYNLDNAPDVLRATPTDTDGSHASGHGDPTPNIALAGIGIRCTIEQLEATIVELHGLALHIERTMASMPRRVDTAVIARQQRCTDPVCERNAVRTSSDGHAWCWTHYRQHLDSRRPTG